MRYLALCVLLASMPAQDAPRDFGHSRHGGAFDEGPRQAAYSMPGLGTAVTFPIAGLSTEAQAFFDQGVTQLHGFWYFEAERSFRQVKKLCPDCAMAHWGMALANVENKPRAAGLIAHAVALGAKAPRSEQMWIDAFARYYQVDDGSRGELRSGDAERVRKAAEALSAKNETRDEKPLARKLIQDLEAIVFEFPQDIEAKALLAVQNWLNYDWGNGIPISSHAGIDALLAQVFAVQPLHPAHHYRIHLWDAEAAERALSSAARIGDSAPGIAHQWHMAGHIYKKLHRHAEAAWQQEASARVDHAYMQRDRVMPFLIHNYGHNQEWLCSSLSWMGRAHEALAVAKNLAELPRHPKWNPLDKKDEIAGYARTSLVKLCEDHELWQEAVSLCRDGHIEQSDTVLAEVQRLSLLGRALFRLGRLDEAERLVAEVDALLLRARIERAAAVDDAEVAALAKKGDDKKVREAMDDAARTPTDAVRAVLDLQRELRGERLLAKGDPKGAVAELEGVDGFPKTLLADCFVAAGEPQKAIDLLEKEVKERPNRFPTTVRLIGARAIGQPQGQLAGDYGELLTRLGVTEHEMLSNPLLRRIGVAVDTWPKLPADRDEPGPFPSDFGARPPLASLGPVTWAPFANPGFSLPWVGREDGPSRPTISLSAAGTTVQREVFDDSGSWNKPTLVIFYLGFGCLHCAQQLQALTKKAGDFTAAGIQILAIGTDNLAVASESLMALPAVERPSFPLLADPDLGAFKAWRCFDDFEEMPLHGTFLVDAEGKVRWADVSADPFTQFDWLLVESRRLLALSAGAGPGSK